MTRMRKAVRQASVVLATATALVFAGAAQVTAASSTSPKEWANDVCAAVQTFADSVDSTISDLKGSESLDKASQDAMSGLESAATELHDTLAGLGRPRTSDGKKAQTAAQDLGDELNKNVAAIEEVLTPPPSSPSDIASAFATIGSEIQKSVSQTKSTANTLKGLKPDGALRKAFQTAPACTQLKRGSSAVGS